MVSISSDIDTSAAISCSRVEFIVSPLALCPKYDASPFAKASVDSYLGVNGREDVGECLSRPAGNRGVDSVCTACNLEARTFMSECERLRRIPDPPDDDCAPDPELDGRKNSWRVVSTSRFSWCVWPLLPCKMLYDHVRFRFRYGVRHTYTVSLIAVTSATTRTPFMRGVNLSETGIASPAANALCGKVMM